MINKIVIAGGNGFLGRALIDHFKHEAKEVIILARHKFSSFPNVHVEIWDGETMGPWSQQLENADVLINLAGKNVNCRYTEENKRMIYHSRLASVRVLGEAVKVCKRPPTLWINTSSATIYKGSFDKFMTEDTGEIGDDFSMDVCKKWECAFQEIILPNTRKIILRTSIVLGRNGGALPALINLARMGFGGPQGDGNQYCSWVHVKDFCRTIEYSINSLHAEGIYNVCVPNPIPNKIFMKSIMRTLNIPIGLPMPEWLLEFGAVFIRTETELILKSRKVFPKRLSDEGFVFEFNDINKALEDLCRNEVRIKRNFTLSH